MVRMRKWNLTDGQTLTLDMRTSDRPFEFTIEAELDTVTPLVSHAWPAVAADWRRLTADPSAIDTRAGATPVRRYVVNSPLAGLRFTASGAAATVRATYYGSIPATVA